MHDLSIHLISLNQENLCTAINIASQIFPYEDTITGPEKSYKESLQTIYKRDKDYWIKYKTLSLQYFLVAYNSDFVGITGFYAQSGDAQDIAWLGWFGVLPHERGKGYGRKILQCTVELLKQKGFKKVRLYTSHNEQIAQRLYEQENFKLLNIEKLPFHKDMDIFYRELSI